MFKLEVPDRKEGYLGYPESPNRFHSHELGRFAGLLPIESPDEEVKPIPGVHADELIDRLKVVLPERLWSPSLVTEIARAIKLIHPLPDNWVLWSRLRSGYKWTQRLDQIELAEAHWVRNMRTRSITERHGKSIVIDGMYGTLGRSTKERTEKYAEVENMILGLAKAA